MGRGMSRVLPARWLALLASLLSAAGCGPLDEPTGTRCGGVAIEIGELQGAEGASPRLHERVTVEGVVTFVSTGAEPSGFFLQSLAADGDPRSSKGLFVQLVPGALPGLRPGQLVRARGRVAELGGRTALDELELLEPCGVAALEPAAAVLGGGDAERWESLLVRSSETWTLVDTSELERSGRVLVSAQGRSYAPGHPLGEAPAQPWALLGLGEKLGAALAAGTVSEQLRLGATAGELTAVVAPGTPPLLLAARPPAFRAQSAPPAPPRPAGALRIAALNLDNYFGQPGSRGARSQQELERQRAKLVALLQRLDADVLALSELGNDPDSADASLSELLAALDAAAPGEPAYQLSQSAASPGGVLRAAIAYRTRQLRAAGASWFASDPAFRRAPLLQPFESASGRFTLCVVHLKSKLCSGVSELVGPEGCGAQQRLTEARALLRVLDSLPGRGAQQALVIGDFNADALEAPLRELRAGGLLDLLDDVPAAERYSYVFEGRASQLDHALAGPALAARLWGAHLWHINADEPALLGYELEHPARAYAADPRRASDHDPLLIDLVP